MLITIIFLTFSLFIFSPFTLHFVLHKKASDDFYKIEIQYFKFTIIRLQVTEMNLSFKGLVPFLSFNFQLTRSKNKSRKSKKVISHRRYDYKAVISVLKETCRIIRRFFNVAKYTMGLIKVSKIDINMRFGYENPALTGIVAGQVWGIIFFVLSLISNYLNFKDASIKVNVIPTFLQRDTIEFYCEGIITLRVVHIIIASLLLITAYFSVKRKSTNKSKGAKKHGWTSN